MSKNLVNLNVNPCKMCMPMGTVSALYGIKGCMSILHGSQGCSTYIRRHMATHYNEPVDIASSSLTEQGTVFGGEKNLIKGLENLIQLYQPQVIGVATTCLAETIGEDIGGIIKRFYESHPDFSGTIIPISSAGYSGTQFEGFFTALRAIVSTVEMKTEKHNKINIVTGMLSPADTRWLKGLLEEMGLEYILLPDLSENLDGVYQPDYHRLPAHGTALEDIAAMAGARLTIELSPFVKDNLSPAQYLKDAYGVPFVRLELPTGLRNTDALVEALTHAGGKITPRIEKERGRYLDAMVDSHKYNATGRAVLFGEPDFVSAMTRLAVENGILPVVAATGARCEGLVPLLREEIAQVARWQFDENYIVQDACDFDQLESYAEKTQANIMIGSSDGRRIEEALHIPLVRCAFPVHDHVGGQRVRTLGYDGSLRLLDRITNLLLDKKEKTFRKELYGKYYTDAPKEPAEKISKADMAILAKERTETHPCYNGCGSGYARLHLPVAPQCNIQCNYCVRKYDCPNESRPGVTTKVLSPAEALERYREVKAAMPNLTVIGIAGPGDALADFDNTRETLELIRREDPKITFCLSTNGLLLPQYAAELVRLQVSHVTVTLNAIDPAIGSKIYKFIRFMGTTYTGETAAAILLSNQLTGLAMLTAQGVSCKVNIVALKGINDHHIPAVVEKAKELGCQISNIMQMIPVKGSAFENMPLTSNKEITELRKSCEGTLKQMYHCRQCRADAIGTLEDDKSHLFQKGRILPLKAAPLHVPQKPEHLFAVASKGGILVDQHFGHANDFYIYGSNGDDIRFIEKRSVNKYCDGAESCDGMGGGMKEGKIDKILETIKDCACVISMRIGEAPRQKLEAAGVLVHTTYDRIEDSVKEAARLLAEKEKEGEKV